MWRNLLLFTVVATINTSYSQNENEIEIDVGMFHYFFDGSPIINFKYTDNATLNTIFFSSIGVNYNRHIKDNHFVTCSIDYQHSQYQKYNAPENNHLLPAISTRKWFNFYIGYLYSFNISEKIKFKIGGSLFYRHGKEIINMAIVPIGNPPFGYETLTESLFNRDFGAKLSTKFQFTIWKFLYFHTGIDFSSILYFGHRPSIDRMRNGYNINKYPTRFDLSWHFGLGFAF